MPHDDDLPLAAPTPDIAAVAPGVILRRAAPADAAGMTACVCEAYLPYVERIGRQPGPMLDDYHAIVAAAAVAGREAWVAVAQRRVVGVLVIETRGGLAWLGNVAVRPDASGTGIGRALLRHAEQRARRLGHDWLFLHTHELMWENRALYARLGWHEYGRHVESGYPRVFMRKPLVDADHHASGEDPAAREAVDGRGGGRP